MDFMSNFMESEVPPDAPDGLHAPGDHARTLDFMATKVSLDLPRTTVYNLWITDSSLPYFLRGRQVHELISEGRMTWRINFEGCQMPWEGEVCDERPAESISWRSPRGRPCPHWGHIRFADTPAGGTQITVGMEFVTPLSLEGVGSMRLLFSRIERFLMGFVTQRPPGAMLTEKDYAVEATVA